MVRWLLDCSSECCTRILILSRLNTKLEANGYPSMTSLVKDLSDGVRLIQLMVCTAPPRCPRDSNEPLQEIMGKYLSTPPTSSRSDGE
jgi:hypothetical protein